MNDSTARGSANKGASRLPEGDTASGIAVADAPPSDTPAVDSPTLTTGVVGLPTTNAIPMGESRLPASPAKWVRRALAGQWGVVALALVVGASAWWFSNRHSLPMMYADARSHLTIARRLVDGPNHSLVQLGTVWLPLPHILTAPLTLFTAWWSSGFAAIPVNLVCLAVEAVALFRVVLLAGRSRLAAWFAVLVLLSNPGWLYLHTTALGEPVLFAAMLVTVAGLSGWVRSTKAYSGGELTVFCGLPAAAAVLSRYDGWAMALAGGIFVLVVAQMRWSQWRYSLRCLRGYAVAPLVAAAWWCWFNWVNWGDPLEFQRGPYSAQAQQDILDRAGLLPDKGALLRSVDTFLTATLEGSGRWVLLAGALGMVAWLLVGRVHLRALAPWLLVTVPVGFYVVSLYTGQIALRLGGSEGESMFNLRYGLQVLPGLAAMAGLGAALLSSGFRRRFDDAADSPEEAMERSERGRSRSSVSGRMRLAATGVLAVVLVVVTTAGWFGDWRQVPVVAEGLQQRELGDPAWSAAEYLHDEAVRGPDQDGLIMIDDSINPMLPVIGADLDRVSAPFSGERWNGTLDDPTRAEWLFVDRSNGGDSVADALQRRPGAAERFDEVFSSGDVSVYRRRGAGS